MTDILIVEQKPNGLVTKSVFYLARNDNAYRRGEVVLPLADDAVAYASANADALWETASQIVSIEWWWGAVERAYRDYYFAVIGAVNAARAVSTDIDVVIGAGLDVIATQPVKAFEFASWRALVALDAPETMAEKRELLNAIITFATTGVVSGGV